MKSDNGGIRYGCTWITVLVIALFFIGIIVVVGLFFPGIRYAPAAGYGMHAPGYVSSTNSRESNGSLSISVQATGSASGIPSQGVIYITVNGTGLNSTAATHNLTTTVSMLNATLQPFIGGNMSNIKTTSYSLSKVYNKTSYEATEAFQVTIPSVQNVSAVIGNLSSLSNVYVQDVSSQLSPAQITKLRAQALSSALANATSQARVVSANGTVNLRNVSVGGFSIFPYPVFGVESAAATAPLSSPGYYTGTEEVTESVSAVFSAS
jgi:uncharacterized protein YggE